MMMLGPVYNVAHGHGISPWFGIVIGGWVLISGWTKYLKGQLRERAHLGILLGITAICALFIVGGILELIR
jgi:hypothetical protein